MEGSGKDTPRVGIHIKWYLLYFCATAILLHHSDSGGNKEEWESKKRLWMSFNCLKLLTAFVIHMCLIVRLYSPIQLKKDMEAILLIAVYAIYKPLISNIWN